MLSFDNIQINGNTLGINICFFGIIYVSLSSKAIQSNTQNHCISLLMLENIFPLSVNTSAGANVLLQGVHPGFHSVPLHHINFVLGTAYSWSKTCISCSGYFFSLLFGIDLAGGKVIMDPIVSEEPSYEEN
jgi:hypothetical protein